MQSPQSLLKHVISQGERQWSKQPPASDCYDFGCQNYSVWSHGTPDYMSTCSSPRMVEYFAFCFHQIRSHTLQFLVLVQRIP